jgi:cholesterol transport system auxiliary component
MTLSSLGKDTKVHLLSSLSLFLSACSILPTPGEAPSRYFLEKASVQWFGPEKKKRMRQIAIEMPVIYTPLDTNRIVILPEKNQLEYYAGIEWSDRLSSLIQDSLLYTLQDTSLFGNISRLTDGINPDVILKIDVRKFYISRDKEDTHSAYISYKPPILPPHKSTMDVATACAELFVTLVDIRTHKILESRTFKAFVPLAEESKEAISQGLNEANKRILLELVDWLRGFS